MGYYITSSMDNIASGKKFTFQIYNPEITGSTIVPCRVVDLGHLTIGTEDAEYGYSRPSEWEIEFRPEVSSSRFMTQDITQFFDMCTKLQQPYFYANVYENGSLFWRGVVDSDSVSSNLLENTISLKIVHETQTTSKMKCNTNPFNYVIRNGKVESHEFFDAQYWIPLTTFFSNYYSYSSEYSSSYSSSIVLANTASVSTGTVFSGSYLNTRVQDSSSFVVREVTGTPGFNVQFSFSASANIQELFVHGRYTGSVSHNVDVKALHPNGTWYTVGNWPHKTADWTYTCILDPVYKVSGSVNVRFIHTSAGNNTHYAYFDYIGISQKTTISSSATFENKCPIVQKFYEPNDGTWEYATMDGTAKTSVNAYSPYLGINTNSFFGVYPENPFPATVGELADAICQSIGSRFIPLPYNKYIIDYQNDFWKDSQNISIQDIQDAQLTYSNSYQGLIQEVTGIYRYMWPNISSEDKMPKFDLKIDYGNVPRKWNAISYLGELIEKDRVKIGDIKCILPSDWMPLAGGSDALAIGLAAIYDIGGNTWERVITTTRGDIYNFENSETPTKWNTLYYQVAEDFLALNTNARKKLKLEVTGINYDFTKSYTVSEWFGTTKFRLLEAEYDYLNNYTTIWLIQV